MPLPVPKRHQTIMVVRRVDQIDTKGRECIAFHVVTVQAVFPFLPFRLFQDQTTLPNMSV